ncbi:MAG: 2-oxoacid:acceptor oxidoreductase family protein [Candidatus Omnitrophica bacterium]|nr:2-oxoacid:acceptor oxidoreductase family protein [Candidatus Omnitrophota bacterium]
MAIKQKTIDEQIIVAGFGGQGVMLLGKIIAQAGMLSGLDVTWIPKYGAEVRGGTAHCMVRVSNLEIASPLVDFPNSLIVMNKLSMDKFERLLRKGGIMIVNSSLVDSRATRSDIRSYYVPANRIASEIGDVRGANMVALGAYLKARPFLKIEKIVEALRDILPSYHHKYIPLNEKALSEGARLVEGRS